MLPDDVFLRNCYERSAMSLNCALFSVSSTKVPFAFTPRCSNNTIWSQFFTVLSRCAIRLLFLVHQCVDGLHHGLFGHGVERGGGTVKHQRFGVVRGRSGYADALALAAREAHPALADEGFILRRRSCTMNTCTRAMRAQRCTCA